MKAIQIKFLGATDTKGSRLKAWSESGSIVTPIDYSMDISEQAKVLAEHYVEEIWSMGDIFKPVVTGFGTLPNGDFVATVGMSNEA